MKREGQLIPEFKAHLLETFPFIGGGGRKRSVQGCDG